ncbi:hypothetical protein DFH06DRAFT_1428726 [Mycena polygramma]|nr:hypothetical protein DFH06DRAFT_1428726 [Mycena polygramma]
MRITNLYRFGFAVSAVQCVVALLAAVLTVSGKVTEEEESAQASDYAWIMVGMSLITVVLGIGAPWFLLCDSQLHQIPSILMPFQDIQTTKLSLVNRWEGHSRAQDLLVAIPFIFSAKDSGFRSSCVSTGFTLWCTPFTMFIIGPIVEMAALFFAAYTIYRRAVIKYGRDKVLPPPQAPVYQAAWKTAPVAELHFPISLERLESHVSGLSVPTIIVSYVRIRLALTLSVIARLCSGVAAVLKPFPHDDEYNDDRRMTYLVFFRLSFIYLAGSALWWILLIYMSRQKASKSELAGAHVSQARSSGLSRLFWFIFYLCIWKRSETFSKIISFCTNHAFRQLECVPLGIFSVLPFVDSFIFFAVAVIIRRRGLALYGSAKVLVEPEPIPDPKPAPAWMLGKVIDLDLPIAAKNETEEADEALELDPLVQTSSHWLNISNNPLKSLVNFVLNNTEVFCQKDW